MPPHHSSYNMPPDTPYNNHTLQITELQTKFVYFERQVDTMCGDIKGIREQMGRVVEELLIKKTQEASNKRWTVVLASVVGSTITLVVQGIPFIFSFLKP